MAVTSIPNQIDSLASEILMEFERVEKDRGNWEAYWEDVARVVMPSHATSFYSRGMVTPGVRKDFEQYDSSPNSALFKFAAAMESMLTPASSKWHNLRPENATLRNDRQAALWFEEVNNLLFYYRYAPHAAFQANQHQCYLNLGVFGTACLYVEPYRDMVRPEVRGLRYINVPIGEVFFDVNAQGQVDKVWRRFYLTGRQIIQKFGEDALPPTYALKIKADPDDKLCIIHSVRPNPLRQFGKSDIANMPYQSFYVLREAQHILSTGGYRVMPYSVPRYTTAPGEKYGRSPAMEALPDIKVLNAEKRTVLEQGQYAVDPVLLANDDGVLSLDDRAPGAHIYGGVNAEGREMVSAMPVGNVQLGMEMMQDSKMSINDHFLVSLFQLLDTTPGMTATEVLERVRQKGALLSPTAGRYQSEGLGPMIERELDILFWEGLLPPPPPQLMGAAYVVEYDAPLNRAMRSGTAASVIRDIQQAIEIAGQTQNPAMLDRYNWDAVGALLSDINGVPPSCINSDDVIAAMRQNRQQQQQQQSIAENLPGMAAMLKAAAPKGISPTGGQPGA